MAACNNAETLAPNDLNIKDSRGLVRALTGDNKGAIEDFQAFIQGTNNREAEERRQSWINDLENNQNPFTSEELDKLKKESESN
ncbi:tetratricopeptide repeat protein [Crocosphaera sp. Alani8]|uniref:tetratricopeptide repeat protein n=1 Tax=Crocosphaera sp. Alani8 TaxID=3038952 RepID=UPI00313B7976